MPLVVSKRDDWQQSHQEQNFALSHTQLNAGDDGILQATTTTMEKYAAHGL